MPSLISWFWLNFLVHELLLSLLFTITGNFLLLSFPLAEGSWGRGRQTSHCSYLLLFSLVTI